jgi:ABC-type antimicrobial peptide transport system permease subunit
VSGLLVRVSDPERMAPQVQRFIQGNAPTPVYARVRPYQDLIDPQMRPWKLGATLFVAFGALALAIAAIGLFGVVSYLVTQRTREIGLRLALGGTGGTVARDVVVGAIKLVAIGLAVGLAGALASGRSIESLLFQTSTYDAGVLAAAVGTLLFVTLLAAAIPAWRAARTSPMVALRTE